MKCIHGMEAAWCGLCLNGTTPRKRKARGYEASKELIAVLRNIKARLVRLDTDPGYRIFFPKRHAPAVDALTRCRVTITKGGGAILSCKDAYEQLQALVTDYLL